MEVKDSRVMWSFQRGVKERDGKMANCSYKG